MKNKEKFAKEIVELACNESDIAVLSNVIVVHCIKVVHIMMTHVVEHLENGLDPSTSENQ